MKDELEIIGSTDNPPDSDRLIESLRDSGYSLNDAIADIIDNSITAGANTIKIIFEMDYAGDIKVFICDNGKGMTKDELLLAMKYGSPRQTNPKSLSKFGLGLKTASTGFCRNLSVVTRAKNRSEINKACWDLDYIANESNGHWTTLFLKVSEDDILKLNKISEEGSGTLVIWNKIDRLLTKNYKKIGGKDHRNALKKLTEELNFHLSRVFQRFLDKNDKREKNININVDDVELRHWDPFCIKQKATELVAQDINRSVELPNGTTSYFSVRAFIIPLREEFSSLEDANIAGISPSNQGVYVYRENRLIFKPDWLDMYVKDPHLNLLRVEFSFGYELDELFKVDFMKSKVSINDSLYDYLNQFLSPPRRAADEKYRKKQKTDISEGSKNAHDISNKSIGEKSDQVAGSKFLSINPATNSAEVQNRSGKFQISIPITSPSKPGELFVQPVDEMKDGQLWQPCIIELKHGVQINTSHPYYHKVYVPNFESGLTMQGLDSLLWALCEAELSTFSDTTKSHFEELRYEVSRILRKLVEDLPDPQNSDEE